MKAGFTSLLVLSAIFAASISLLLGVQLRVIQSSAVLTKLEKMQRVRKFDPSFDSFNHIIRSKRENVVDLDISHYFNIFLEIVSTIRVFEKQHFPSWCGDTFQSTESDIIIKESLHGDTSKNSVKLFLLDFVNPFKWYLNYFQYGFMD